MNRKRWRQKANTLNREEWISTVKGGPRFLEKTRARRR
jgi:hypothetical protein